MPIAYGVCIGTEAKYQRFAHASLAKYAPDALVLERRHQTSIFVAYNSILDEVCTLEDVDGLVLMHEDVELRQSVQSVLLQEFHDPSIAIVGVIGGRGVRGVRWDRAQETLGYAPDAFHGENDRGRGFADVDIVDGLFIGMSPWAVRNLRFDEQTYHGFHAYDADICMQARAAGRRVRVADINLFHHTKGGFGNIKAYRRFDDAFRRKWGVALDSRLHRFIHRLKNQPY